MRFVMMRALALSLAVVVGACGDDSFSPTIESVAGSYTGTTFTLTSAAGSSDLLILEPVWRNFFENPKTVQFVHRAGGYAVFLLALWHMIATGELL